ncbi:BnaAnng36900D [Brassica napus]|uniref:BnaAnng36900D protein n=1 Tax=Brassica napus TaxID=3708 RepID=A0A078JUU2_BRANA|nr:BnaAnng36900D [Brassica napus]
MDMNSWFDRVKEDRKNLSFSKTFACADLSSECMRTFPFDLMKSLPKEDLSNKMVIIAKWGSSWEVDISKNPRFYYMEKSGWNQFVRDNALGKNEFVTFTHKGSMCFDVNIYGKDEKEIVRPPTMASSSGIKQEQGASMEGVEFEATEKKAEESKRKIKKVVNPVEIGESSRGVKKVKRGRVRVKNGVPEFEITIKRSGLGHVVRFLIYKRFKKLSIKI